MAEARTRPGNTPIQQQERDADTAEATGPLRDAREPVPRPGPDTEAFPGERQPDEEMTERAR